MKESLALFPGRKLVIPVPRVPELLCNFNSSNLMPPYGPGAFLNTQSVPDDPPRDTYSRIGQIVDEVVSDSVLAALPHEKAGRPVVQFADVVDQVVRNKVLPVHIFGAGAVTGEQDANAAQMLKVVPNYPVPLGIQIKTNARATGGGEVAVFNGTILCTTESQHRTGTVEAFPVVLKSPSGLAMPRETVAVSESQATKDDILDRNIFRPFVIGLAFNADQLGKNWSHNIIARDSVKRPQVQFSVSLPDTLHT